MQIEFLSMWVAVTLQILRHNEYRGCPVSMFQQFSQCFLAISQNPMGLKYKSGIFSNKFSDIRSFFYKNSFYKNHQAQI